METLSNTWFTEGNIDFELKKYTLLAYLIKINSHFHKNQLYPALSDLIFHYNNLIAFKKNKESLQNNFPQRLSATSFEELKLTYERMILDDKMIQEIESIIHFSLQKMEPSLKEGQEIYEFVQEQFTINPVGLLPIQKDHGYLFLCDGNEREIGVYQYHITLFENHLDKYRGIHTDYISSYPRNLINTYSQIKVDLLKNKQGHVNPAVYSIETPLTFPIRETLLPIAKRSLVQYISQS